MRRLKAKVPKKKLNKHIKIPDVESIEKDVELPHTVELIQACEDGTQKSTFYYTAKSWAKEDVIRQDAVELMCFERGSKKRWFTSYVLKAIYTGVGYFISRRISRHRHRYEALLEDELKADRDMIIKKWVDKYGSIPPAHNAWLQAFYFYLAVDNAYSVFYKEVKQEIIKRAKP